MSDQTGKADHHRVEHFEWNGMLIRQDEVVHKVGTDAILLGSWIPRIIPEARFILDVGTGSGVLALMMARNYPEAFVHAIDVDEHAIRLAQHNAHHAIHGIKMEVRLEDILHRPEHPHQYDLVISNPPYHSAQTFPREAYRQKARHISGSVSDWMSGMCSRLNADGHLIIIIPSDSASTWIKEANAVGYHNTDRLDVFSFEGDNIPLRTLLHIESKLEKPRLSKLEIYRKDKQYTTAYCQMTGIRPNENTVA